MIEYERTRDGSLRYVTQLAKEGDGLRMEVSYNRKDYLFGGELVMTLRDDRNNSRRAEMTAKVFEDKLVQLGETEVRLAPKVISPDCRGLMLVLGAWYLLELGIDQVNVGRREIRATEKFMQAVDLRLGESRMESFFKEGGVEFGGLSYRVEMDEWPEGSQSTRFRAGLEMPDGSETLAGTVWQDREGTAVHLYVDELESGWEDWATPLLYLTVRYVEHHYCQLNELRVFIRTDNFPRETEINPAVMEEVRELVEF